MLSQTISNRYISRGDLSRLLKTLFNSEYKVKENKESYTLTIPRLLTEVHEYPSSFLCMTDAEIRQKSSPSPTNRELGRGCACVIGLRCDNVGSIPTSRRMEVLRSCLIKLRRCNVENRYFIPEERLMDVMQENLVHAAIHEAGFESYQAKEITATIMKGARKIFAILLMIRSPESIKAFVQHDQFQALAHDYKLPFTLSKLEDLLPNETAVTEFHNHQWEFTSPIFTNTIFSRTLEMNTILPFTKDEVIGEGGWGIVHLINIDPDHQSTGVSSNQTFVRKEFRPQSNSRRDFELELRNLSILSLARHPYIIEMLGAYTFRDKHNLIFPFARSGSLMELFDGKRPKSFKTDTHAISAICGLSSALGVVHDLRTTSLQAIGCHHDLKPSNILLDEDRLLLADFGLTRFKDSSEASWSMFRAGRGDYLAPECEDLEGDFNKNVVHRSSDIWSFGCILLEMVVYLNQGPTGIAMFRDARTFKIENWTFSHFHCGRDRPNPIVLEYLVKAYQSEASIIKPLLTLISSMLSLTPQQRPRIQQVTSKLRYIAIKALTQPLTSALDGLVETTASPVALLENAKFRSWVWALEKFEKDDRGSFDEFLGDLPCLKFESILQDLQRMQDSLQTLIPQVGVFRRQVFLSVRDTNDFLLQQLPEGYHGIAKTYAESRMLSHSDPQLLADISNAMQDASNSDDVRVGLLAAIKRLNILLSKKTVQHHETDSINPDDLQVHEKLESFSISLFTDPVTKEVSKKVVEWKRYDEGFFDDSSSDELFGRLEAIAELLKLAHKQSSLRVLSCRGFCHDARRMQFGLVYDVPRMSMENEKMGQRALLKHQPTVGFLTLRKILDEDPNGTSRPALGARFRLAQKLASSVFEFHRVEWLQESISSFNIVFLKHPHPHPHPHPTVASLIDSPYFMGFLESRQGDLSAFTEGPMDDPRHQDYQHPEYLRGNGRVRFRVEFDYYSLGMVLLEIGLWKSLGTITSSQAFAGKSPEELHSIILRKIVPLLGQKMGLLYQLAVDACLRGCGEELSSSETGDGGSDLHSRFRTLVVDQLDQCKA